MPYFFDILPHIFKYKNPPDYYIIPILSFFIILVLELSYCLKILNLSYYCVSYFILGFLFKIILILTFAYSFETGYEYFFEIIAVIFMIYLYLTLTFLIFNLCNKNSNDELKSNNKFLWFFSLLACIISDYRCLELFTRTKIDFIEINDENNKKNKKAEIKKEKEKNKIKNKSRSISRSRHHHKREHHRRRRSRSRSRSRSDSRRRERQRKNEELNRNNNRNTFYGEYKLKRGERWKKIAELEQEERSNSSGRDRNGAFRRRPYQ